MYLGKHVRDMALGYLFKEPYHIIENATAVFAVILLYLLVIIMHGAAFAFEVIHVLFKSFWHGLLFQ